jgi:DNA gyrase subunit A
MGKTLEPSYIPVNITKQVQEDYLAYSLSVLVGRAIPDLYDGMKVSQRRILQVMLEEGLLPEKKYVKSARITGLTMGLLHPQGDCYGTLVNMATTWNNNVPWIDGHGNFGSTTDPAASPRYTEAKLRPAAIDLLLQDRQVWETKPNYDGSRTEAVRFNSSLPTVLLNGDSGIAVGFATKLAPHNLQSVVESIRFICKDATTEKTRLENLRKARECFVPDFPTGPDIVKDDQLDQYLKTGAGNIRCIAKYTTSTTKKQGKGKEYPTITFTNLPPGTNPEKLGEQIKNELDKGRVVGVTEINDLSDLTGDRLEIVAKAGTNLEILKQQLFSCTELDVKYSAKTLVIDDTKPVELAPVDIVKRWIDWRLDRLLARFERELGLKKDRAHIVEGLVKAIDKMDQIIKKIRSSKDKAEAMDSLMSSPLKFTAPQAEAILEMRLRQLTNLDQADLLKEFEELKTRIEELKVLADPCEKGIKERKKFMVSEVTAIGKKYGEDRRSNIIESSSVSYSKSVEGRSKATPALPKPRFLKVDMTKGTVAQVKGPRGAMMADSKEKIILMTEDGMLRKVPATFKGAISSSYSPVSLARREKEVCERKYLTVFELDGQVKAMVMVGEDLCKVTSKGKQWLPEGAKLLYFGENSYTVNWISKRKKPVVLDLTTKAGKPGSRGIKIAEVQDTKIG